VDKPRTWRGFSLLGVVFLGIRCGWIVDSVEEVDGFLPLVPFNRGSHGRRNSFGIVKFELTA
jgi:hypothetical protein